MHEHGSVRHEHGEPNCFEPDCNSCSYSQRCKNRKYNYHWDWNYPYTIWVESEGTTTTDDFEWRCDDTVSSDTFSGECCWSRD